MKHNIFTSTKHWRFTAADEAAEEKFKQLESAARESLPENFYHRPLVRLDLISASPLYALLKDIPKGVMHHNHYFCNDDADFYRRHILTDPRVYLSGDLGGFEVGTRAEAAEKGWVSMAAGAQRFGSEEWLRRVVELTCFSREEMQSLNYKSYETWTLFERKIRAPLKLLFVLDIFRKYSRHMLEKYISNGYDRIEVRSTYEKLAEYDAEGNFVKRHDYQAFIDALDGVVEELTAAHPSFSFGLIFAGFKVFTDEYNEEMFEMACRTNWRCLVGFDFVQEEDKYDSLARYDPIVERVLRRHPELGHLRKAYHAGETSSQLTENVDVAVKAGSVRIGHGLNILQRVEFLPHCRHVCFEKNPISNLLLGYKSDLREASAPVLLGLGYPVSISPDDPGKFGYGDSTPDYLVAALCYNWSLRHLKLVGYHSINHAICEEAVKTRLISSFEKAWDAWVHRFLERQHLAVPEAQFHDEDVFTFSRNWSFSEAEEQKSLQFVRLVDGVISSTPENIYQNCFFQSKNLVQSSRLFALLRNMPKGVLQSCHFIANHDADFIRRHVLPDHDIYLNSYSKELMIATPLESERHSWTSLEKLKLQFEGEQELAAYVYSLTAFTSEELAQVAGHQPEFHRLCRKKLQNLRALLASEAIFRKFTRNTLKKLADEGYLRVEFRIEPIRLVRYSQNGEEEERHGYGRMVHIINEEYKTISEEYPSFTIGFIVLGNKHLTREENAAIFEEFAVLNWCKCIGFDFEQEIEDSHPPLGHFAAIIDEVLLSHEELDYWKVFEAGNSSNHLNNNIEVALESGGRRICNGLNILQQVGLLAKCRDVCFEVNPILNLAEGASLRTDFRLSIAPVLLGLGFPVTINSDLSGLMGLEETTYDLFVAAISYNWSLKHFKLMLLHSITHSCAAEGRQKLMLKAFEQRWQQWIQAEPFE